MPGLGLGIDLSLGPRGGGGGPSAPSGYILLIDDDGAYLTDDDGTYLMEKE